MKKFFASLFSFAKDGLSIDETKTSSLIIGFLVFLGFTIFFYYQDRTLGENWTNILLTLIGVVGGTAAVVQGVKGFVEYQNNKNNNSDEF